MVRNKLAGAAVGALLLGGVVAPSASAQSEEDAPLDNPVTEDTNADDEGGFDDWGLLGLLGLLGLAGLAKKRNDDVVVRRDATTGTGSSTQR